MNPHLNFQGNIVSQTHTNWPVRTVGPFPRESIRFMMGGGRERAEVTEMGMLSEDLAC